MLDDGLFEGLDAALLFHPCDRDHAACALLACEDVEVTFTGLQAHAASRPVARPQRARRDGPALQLGRPVAAAAARRMPASTASSPRAARRPTSSPTGRSAVHDPQHRPGLLRVDAPAVPRAWSRRPAWRPARGGDRLQRRPRRSEGQRHARGRVPGQHRAARASSTRASTRSASAAPTWATSAWSLPTIHPTWPSATTACPGHSTLFRDAAATPRADETTLLAATLVAQTAYELFTEPGLVEAAWREFRGA